MGNDSSSAVSQTGPSMGEITDILRRHGITSTLQRVEIAQILLAKKAHYSAEQVLDMVNHGRDVVSKATVYNTLKLFAEKGLVKEIFADPAKVFFEPKTTEHPHFFNEITGELIDIDPELVKIESLPEAPAGCHVRGVDVIIRIRNTENRG